MSSAQFAGDLTIQAAATAKDVLLALVHEAGEAGEAAGDLRLDLSGVTELDTAGVQLLLMLRRELMSEGRGLALVHPAEAVSSALALAGLLETMDVT